MHRRQAEVSSDSGCGHHAATNQVRARSAYKFNYKESFAANATEIDLEGEVKVVLKVGGLEIPTVALISDNVEEGLIGYDWLAVNDIFWGFWNWTCIHCRTDLSVVAED